MRYYIHKDLNKFIFTELESFNAIRMGYDISDSFVEVNNPDIIELIKNDEVLIAYMRLGEIHPKASHKWKVTVIKDIINKIYKYRKNKFNKSSTEEVTYVTNE